MKILEVQNLVTEFPLRSGTIRPVDDVSFRLEKGKILGIVGESGCGKTLTALSLLRLVDPPGRITGGKVLFYQSEVPEPPMQFHSLAHHEITAPGIQPQSGVEGEAPSALPMEGATQAPMIDPVEGENAVNLLSLPEEEMRRIRGNRISMIFQEPMTSLNPVYTVGDQIMEAILLHQGSNKKEAREKAILMLQRVGIPDATRRVDDYPSEMSGGMRQRVMIAMALSCRPKILIADEPTTALDVTIQAQILDLIEGIIEEMQMSMILITHDLGVVAETCDDVLVMYAGKVVEEAPVERLFNSPKHPYTIALLESIPTLLEREGEPFRAITGSVPDLRHLPSGCRFRDRCPRVSAACGTRVPSMKYVGSGQSARCINT